MATCGGWSVLIGFVLWLPPLIDMLTNWPGNLGEIASYFLHPLPPDAHRVHGGSTSARGRVRADPDWLRGSSGLGFAGFPVGKSLAMFVLPTVLLAVGIVSLVVAARPRPCGSSLVAGPRRRRGSRALVEGQPLLYLFFWRPVIAIALVLGVGWALLAGRKPVRRYGPVAGSILAVLISRGLGAVRESMSQRVGSRLAHGTGHRVPCPAAHPARHSAMV